MASSRLHVAMVAPAFPLSEGVLDGGTQAAPYHLCRALSASGEIDVTVIRPFSGDGEMGDRLVAGIRVCPLAHGHGLMRTYSALAGSAAQVNKLIEQIGADVAHVQNNSWLAALMKRPCVFTLHGIPEKDILQDDQSLRTRLRAMILRLTLGTSRKRLKNVIAISPYSRDELGPERATRRVWDIPNPIPDSFFGTIWQPQRGVVFCASHMNPLKNLKRLIRSFALLARGHPQMQLRLAGSRQNSEYGNECRREVKALGIEGQVCFLGLLSVEQVRQELQRAACFALCSLRENLPMAIAEAMAVGVPVVGARVGGVPSMIRDGVSGWLVDPADEHDIASRLTIALDLDAGSQFSIAARSAAGIYRAVEVARKTIEVYRQVLAVY